MRFVIRLKDGESMPSLCPESGILRKTGYKIYERYQQCGLEGPRTSCLSPWKQPLWRPRFSSVRTPTFSSVGASGNLGAVQPAVPPDQPRGLRRYFAGSMRSSAPFASSVSR